MDSGETRYEGIDSNTVADEWSKPGDTLNRSESNAIDEPWDALLSHVPSPSFYQSYRSLDGMQFQKETDAVESVLSTAANNLDKERKKEAAEQLERKASRLIALWCGVSLAIVAIISGVVTTLWLKRGVDEWAATLNTEGLEDFAQKLNPNEWADDHLEEINHGEVLPDTILGCEARMREIEIELDELSRNVVVDEDLGRRTARFGELSDLYRALADKVDSLKEQR